MPLLRPLRVAILRSWALISSTSALLAPFSRMLGLRSGQPIEASWSLAPVHCAPWT